MPNTYETEQVILAAKAEIDAILRPESKLGNDKSAKAIYACLSKLQSELEGRGIKDNAHLIRLLQISFGSFEFSLNPRQTAKTRLEEFYSNQVMNPFDASKWIQLGSFFKQLINPLSRIRPDELIDNSVKVVIDAEMRHQNELALAVPFLQRMLDSQNFPQGDKEQLNNFLNKLNPLRLRLSKLPLDARSLSAYYQSREYQQCQKLLAELESTYSHRIKPLILKADMMNKGELKGGFHWHLDGSVEECLTVLDNLHAKHQEKINNLISRLPVGEMTPIHSARQKRQSEYSGQQLVRKLLGDVPAADKKATFFSANNSGLTRKSALATQLLTDFDPELPMLPESIKEDDDFKRGCLEELLISARPHAFQIDSLTGNFKVLDGRLASFLNIKNNELNPKNFQSPDDSSDPLCTLLYCLKPVDDTFTIENKIDAYIELIKCVRTGQLNLSTSADHLTQAREIAEKLLYLAVMNEKTERLTPVNALIKSGVIEQGFKKMKQGGEHKSGVKFEDQTIQRLYGVINKLPRNDELLQNLKKRLTSLHDITIPESVSTLKVHASLEQDKTLHAVEQLSEQATNASTNPPNTDLHDEITSLATPVEVENDGLSPSKRISTPEQSATAVPSTTETNPKKDFLGAINSGAFKLKSAAARNSTPEQPATAVQSNQAPPKGRNFLAEIKGRAVKLKKIKPEEMLTASKPQPFGGEGNKVLQLAAKFKMALKKDNTADEVSDEEWDGTPKKS